MEFTISIKPMGGSLSSIIEKIDPPPKRHGQPWTEGEDKRLIGELDLAFSMIAAAHGRTKEAIINRTRNIYG